METFVVDVIINTRPYQKYILSQAFKYQKIITKRLLALEKKKLTVFDSLSEVISLREKLAKVKDPVKKKNIQKVLSFYRKQCCLTRFDIIKDVKEFYKPYKEYISSQMSQSIAKRVDEAVAKYIENNDIELKCKENINSIESESAYNGIKFDGNNIIYKNMVLPLKIKKDSYFPEAIKTCKLKYIRIVKRIGKTRIYYVGQFIFQGEPISKRKIKLGSGNVGIDLGTSTIAYCSENEVRIEEFSKELIKTDNEIALINKKLDSSRRINNPDNFNDDGTVKEKSLLHPWKKSHHYLRLNRRRKYLFAKFKRQRNNLYEIKANALLSKGNRFITEPMDYKALARRAEETKKDENGRFIKKSRFGKSLLNHAPSLFINILSRKLGYLGIILEKVNIKTFKASQYNHIKDEYIKCDLNERSKDIGGYEVQRDLYSAFLLMNADDTLMNTDRNKCNQTFDNFLKLHDKEILRLL